MALANYTDIKAAIISEAWRSGDAEADAKVDDWIRGAEILMQDGSPELGIPPLRVAQMEAQSASLAMVSGVATLPADFLEARWINANSSPAITLTPISVGGATTDYPNNAGNEPRGYEIIGSTIVMVPNAGATTLNLRYYRTIPPLSSGSPTNWLVTRSPYAYIYGAVVFAAPWMQDDPQLTRYAKLYSNVIKGLNSADRSARHPRIIPRYSQPVI